MVSKTENSNNEITLRQGGKFYSNALDEKVIGDTSTEKVLMDLAERLDKPIWEVSSEEYGKFVEGLDEAIEDRRQQVNNTHGEDLPETGWDSELDEGDIPSKESRGKPLHEIYKEEILDDYDGLGSFLEKGDGEPNVECEVSEGEVIIESCSLIGKGTEETVTRRIDSNDNYKEVLRWITDTADKIVSKWNDETPEGFEGYLIDRMRHQLCKQDEDITYNNISEIAVNYVDVSIEEAHSSELDYREIERAMTLEGQHSLVFGERTDEYFNAVARESDEFEYDLGYGILSANDE